MTAKGIHIVDQMIWLCGPVDSVYALSDRRTGLYAPLDDTTSLALHFKSGVTGALSSIYATAEFWRLHAFGSKAWAQVTGESTLTVCEAGGKPYTREFADIDTARAALEGFADAVTAGEPYAVPPEDAIASSAVLEAMARSADAGAPVRIA
jgi:predicted dehydrogenase